MTTKDPSNGGSQLTKVFLFIGAWLFLVFMVLLEIGRVPRTAVGWACLVVAGPAVYLAFSALGDWLFSKEHGEMVSRSKFSIARMAIAFVVLVFIFLAGIIADGLMGGRD